MSSEFGTYRVSYTPTDDYDTAYVEPTINMSISGEANLSEMLSFFDAFLKASGYIYDGELNLAYNGIVNKGEKAAPPAQVSEPQIEKRQEKQITIEDKYSDTIILEQTDEGEKILVRASSIEEADKIYSDLIFSNPQMIDVPRREDNTPEPLTEEYHGCAIDRPVSSLPTLD